MFKKFYGKIKINRTIRISLLGFVKHQFQIQYWITAMYAVCGNIMRFEKLNIVKFVLVRNLKSQRSWPSMELR
jgi:hypothetical protein